MTSPTKRGSRAARLCCTNVACTVFNVNTTCHNIHLGSSGSSGTPVVPHPLGSTFTAGSFQYRLLLDALLAAKLSSYFCLLAARFPLRSSSYRHLLAARFSSRSCSYSRLLTAWFSLRSSSYRRRLLAGWFS